MLRTSIGRPLCAAAAACLLSIPARAQETYSLRGEGAHEGMAFTAKQVFKMSFNGQKTLTSINSKTVISKVSRDGEILGATMTFIGDSSANSGSSEEDPFVGLYNVPISYIYEGTAWNVTCDDPIVSKSEAFKEFANGGAGPTMNRHHLPLISVPVGLKWTRDESEGFAGIDARNAKLAEMFNGMKGKASYLFDSVKTYNGASCAVIKCDFSYKGNIKLGDKGEINGTGKFSGSTLEYRRLDTGLQVRLESTGSFSGSVPGAKMTMDIEGLTTLNMIQE